LEASHQLKNFAAESFGIECGRLAGLPESLLTVASKSSSDLQHDVQGRIKRKKYVLPRGDPGHQTLITWFTDYAEVWNLSRGASLPKGS
jgi:DNA mismatch repair ATPase MutS